MRWWSPVTCRSRSPLPRRLTNRAFDVPCYEPGYTLVEKLQTISTKFRRHLEDGSMPQKFLRHYYDVYCLLGDPGVQAFLGTEAYVGHKDERFPAADNKEIAENRSEEHTTELQSLMRITYAVFCVKNK